MTVLGYYLCILHIHNLTDDEKFFISFLGKAGGGGGKEGNPFSFFFCFFVAIPASPCLPLSLTIAQGGGGSSYYISYNIHMYV